ncbi:BspA family leucine-rich repeat surface protein, partial [Enterococcus faecium]|nr:BspA family leucine-rich repeat surface protein [Enterococcus faecium]
MYCPLAIKQVARTVNANETYGQNEMQQNVVLRDPNSGAELTDTQGLSITAVNQSGENVPLDELTKRGGTYTVTYSYQGEKVDETVIVESGDWQWSKNGNNITLEDYIGQDKNVVIPTAKDLGYDGAVVTISAEVLKDVATDAQSITTSDNGNKIVMSSNSLKEVFRDNNSLEKISFTNFDITNVTNMENMFMGCTNLTSLDLSSFDTTNVTNMKGMFASCKGLTSLDLSGLNTANVTNMESMFAYSDSLTSLNLSSFDTRNVTNMTGMFVGCTNLTSLDLSSFDTTNVTTTEIMFFQCFNLINIDLSNFNTANVTNMGYMFNTFGKKTPLLIKTTDEKLKKYNYSSDSRVKFGTVKIDSKYGNFNGQASTSLFDYTTDQELTETLINQKLEKAKQSITFEKGAKFIQWQPEATYSTLLEKANGTYNVEAKIEDKTSISLKNTTTTKYIGDIYGEDQLRANINGLTDIEGLDVLVQDRAKVTITAKNSSNQSVNLSDLTKTPGNYTITYSYNGKTVEEKLTVEDSYYMIIPKEYHFQNSFKNQKLNGTVKMVSKSNPTNEYTGDISVGMTISSSKNFSFNNGGEYLLTDGTKELARKNSKAAFTLEKGNNLQNVNAKLVKEGKKVGDTDSLIFSWGEVVDFPDNTLRNKVMEGLSISDKDEITV